MARKDNSIVKTGEGGDELAVVLTPEMQEMFSEVGGGHENLDHVSNPYFTISIQGGRFKLGGRPIGDKGFSLEGRIMRIAHVRSYYQQPFDPQKPVPPDCSSVGGIRPSVESPAKQCDNCASCPQNKWGTGRDAKGQPSRGKACKESRRLVLQIDGVELPCNLSIPPTALKTLEDFLKMCSTLIPGGVPVWAVKAVFSFDESKTWPCPTIQLIRGADGGPVIVKTREEFECLLTLKKSEAYAKAEMAYASAEEVGDLAGEHSDSSEVGANTPY